MTFTYIKASEMVLTDRNRIHFKSFHHRIKEGNTHYVDDQQFLGIDPFDHSKFKKIYSTKVLKMKRRPGEE